MNCVIFIQTLGNLDRKIFIEQNILLYPDINIFQSVNGYNIEETNNELKILNVKYNNLHFKTYGTLANWITKMKAFQYQVDNSIDYMCLIEDDILLNPGFKEFIDSLLPNLNENINMIRLAQWGEGYVTHIDGAKRILDCLRSDGIIQNIDNQLRVHCGNEFVVTNTPFQLMVYTNMGDCLKTKEF